jgi:hypothetical protein
MVERAMPIGSLDMEISCRSTNRNRIIPNAFMAYIGNSAMFCVIKVNLGHVFKGNNLIKTKYTNL